MRKRENTQTASLVYGHRRGIGSTFYLRASFGRTLNPDSLAWNYQTEVFAKGSWSFDVL